MKSAITYTVLAILNLVGYTIGVALLPSPVPIHFDVTLTADAMGSAWVYLAFPAAAALISVAVWTAALSRNEKNRTILMGLMSGIGAVFACIGWIFFALFSGGVGYGEEVPFPFALTFVLPFSLFIMWLGNYMPRVKPNRLLGIRTRATLNSEEVWTKTHRLGGVLFFCAGVLSAISAVVFSCVKGNLDLVAVAVLIASLIVAAIWSAAYASVLYRREHAEKTE